MGLHTGDLEDLILPLLSVDEYESKIASNNEAIVVGFFAEDEDPAKDLSSFILKSAIDILDTNVSQAPNEEGYFMVWVELARNSRFPKKVMDLVDNVKVLTGEQQWKFKPYGTERIFDLTEKNLKKLIDLSPESKEPKSKEKDSEKRDVKKDKKDKKDVVEELNKWLRYSDLDNFGYNKEKKEIVLERYNQRETFRPIAFGSFEFVTKKINATGKPYKLDEYTRWKNKKIEYMFGSGWFVNQLDDYLVIGNEFSDKFLVVK